MPGKISFHFDDGHISHYQIAFPIFQAHGVSGCLSLIANPHIGMGYSKAMEMQRAGWEILCHSASHPTMQEALPEKVLIKELVESKQQLEAAGFLIRQFVTPCSTCHSSALPLLQAQYSAAFTVYTQSGVLPVEKLVLEKPVNSFALHRACLSGLSLDTLKTYVDYVALQDAWLVFYDHDIGTGRNIDAATLDALLSYCREKQVAIMTSSQALDAEPCRTKILQEGWDGKDCYVHIRPASDGQGNILLTGQKMDVTGCDCFELLQTKISRDNGRSWTDLTPCSSFHSTFTDKLRSICCDMTPFYHRKTGKFLVTGHIAQYSIGSNVPIDPINNRRFTPYAVFDFEKEPFGAVKCLNMPDPVKYQDCGAGCSQCLEEDNGDLLIPLSFRETVNGVLQNAKATVVRASFDGETLTCVDVGNDLEVPEEVRGIGECSIIRFQNRYYLTIRGDTHGYVSYSEDGLHFTQPIIWRYTDGQIVPTYNTQSHWLTCSGKLYLVYTHKNGKNDHVFRHRAPLYAALVDVTSLQLVRESDLVIVPERGARLGNFGVCSNSEEEAIVVVSEWMQPSGCEAYGSNNAIWFSQVTL